MKGKHEMKSDLRYQQSFSSLWVKTRTTKTPAFWYTPPTTTTTTNTWLPILVIHIRSQVKTRQSQRYKFKKIAKNSNFEILQETLYATHLLKLLDKLYKYEMDPTRTLSATERTRDAGRMDRRTDGRTEWNQYTPPTTSFVNYWEISQYDLSILHTTGWTLVGGWWMFTDDINLRISALWLFACYEKSTKMMAQWQCLAFFRDITIHG